MRRLRFVENRAPPESEQANPAITCRRTLESVMLQTRMPVTNWPLGNL